MDHDLPLGLLDISGDRSADVECTMVTVGPELVFDKKIDGCSVGE